MIYFAILFGSARRAGEKWLKLKYNGRICGHYIMLEQREGPPLSVLLFALKETRNVRKEKNQ
jgi:hypothetical protein